MAAACAEICVQVLAPTTTTSPGVGHDRQIPI